MNPQIVPLDAQHAIQLRLDAIERDHSVRILLAVESGSRAWGFHSADSDFDARFIYVRAADDYLSLTPQRDVIETPIEGLFDVNGWDLSKALHLIMRGNSVVHEWINSPLRYRAAPGFIEALTPVAAAWRTVFADTHHYHGLLASQWRRFIDGREQVRLKKYFYVIRPALALQWLRECGGSPPMDLPSLLAGVTPPETALHALETLRAMKSEASELGEGPRIPALDAYIQSEAAWAMANKHTARPENSELAAQTDALFRKIVRGRL